MSLQIKRPCADMPLYMLLGLKHTDFDNQWTCESTQKNFNGHGHSRATT